MLSVPSRPSEPSPPSLGFSYIIPFFGDHIEGKLVSVLFPGIAEPLNIRLFSAGCLTLGKWWPDTDILRDFWRLYLHDRDGASVLSDDRIVIRPDGNGFRIYGTPWHTDSKCDAPGSAPLEAVFILEQAPRNRVQEMPPSSAVAQMMVRAFPSMWDHEGLDFAVRFLTRLAERVPVRRLHFLADTTAADTVLSTLGLPEAV